MPLFNIRFPGQYYDDETKLHYNRFRYYDPGVGRYVSADPIGQFGILASSLGSGGFAPGAGENLYRYAFANPVHLVDPSGTVVPLIVGAIFTGAAIGVGGSTLAFGLAAGADFLFGRNDGGAGAGSVCDPSRAGGGFLSENAGDFGEAIGGVAAINALIGTVLTGGALLGQAAPIVQAAAVANAARVPAAFAVGEAFATTSPGGATRLAQAASALNQSVQNLTDTIRDSLGINVP